MPGPIDRQTVVLDTVHCLIRDIVTDVPTASVYRCVYHFPEHVHILSNFDHSTADA